MNLIELINQELGRGFTKSELERIWDLPKNSLSAVLNPENKATLSKKGEIRVKAYFDTDPINRPNPSPRIERVKKTANDKPKEAKKEDSPPPNNGKMPEGLDWKQQLEWKRNNKK